jgi:hypothetical protein
MSLKDQYSGMYMATVLFYATGIISFAFAYYLNRFIICVHAVLGVAFVYGLFFLPNWRGRKDTMADIKGTKLEGKPIVGVIGEWVSASETESFYGQLMEFRDALSGTLRTEQGTIVTPSPKSATSAAPPHERTGGDFAPRVARMDIL